MELEENKIYKLRLPHAGLDAGTEIRFIEWDPLDDEYWAVFRGLEGEENADEFPIYFDIFEEELSDYIASPYTHQEKISKTYNV